MIHIGSFEVKTEIFVLLVSLLLLSIQLLLCFKAKKTAVRLIPIYPTAGLTVVFVALGFIFDDWDAFAFFFLAICSAAALFMCGVAWAIWWVVDSLVAYISKSTKKQTVTLFSVIAAAVLIVVISVSLFKYNYPTYYPYKDREIIGSTPEEIEEKYGEFWAVQRDDENVPTFAKYMIRDNTPDLIMSKDDSLWYHIYFKDGVAVEVKLQKGWPGG